MTLSLGAFLPDHSRGTRWVWRSSVPGEPDLRLTVVRVTRRTVRMVSDCGVSVTFHDKYRALRSRALFRVF